MVTAVGVHGEDGMGDQGLINSKRTHCKESAVSKIIEIVRENPNEIEIITIGPLTNVAKAILLEPEVMKHTKRIYSMGTSGLGAGNTTPVSEFNVYVDAESYDILLRSLIPITIIGFDICLGESALNENDLDFLLNSNKKDAVFAVKINKTLQDYNYKNTGEIFIDLPDAVAMGVLLWDDIVLSSVYTRAVAITNNDETYGQVIFYCDRRTVLYYTYKDLQKNVTLITGIDAIEFKKRMIELLVK